MADSAKSRPNRQLRLVLDEQERERTELAHQLHDQLAQSLGAMLLRLEGLERRAPAADAAQLAALREQLDDALSLCTDLAVGLRPAVLDQLGLEPALNSLAERRGADRLRVDPALAAARLKPDLETEVYRTVEEALGAVSAGGALTVSLDAAGHTLVVSIQASDDRSAIGDLARVEARVGLIGGTLDADSHACTIRIPIAPGPQAQPRVFRSRNAWRLPMARSSKSHSVET